MPPINNLSTTTTLPALASILALIIAAPTSHAQPAPDQTTQLIQIDQPTDNETHQEAQLAWTVLLHDGTVRIASRVTIQTDAITIIEPTAGQPARLERSTVLAIFIADPAARANLGIAGLANAGRAPLIPPARLRQRNAAADNHAIRTVEGITIVGTHDPTPQNADNETIRFRINTDASPRRPAQPTTETNALPTTGIAATIDATKNNIHWAIPIDRVAWVWADPIHTEWLALTNNRQPIPPTSDIIALRNRDTITGFLLAFADQLHLEPQAGPILTIPIDRAVGALLANPRDTPEGTWAFTETGLAFPIESITGSTATTWQPTSPARPPFALPLRPRSLTAIVFDTQRVRPLSTLPPPAITSTSPTPSATAPASITLVPHPLDTASPIAPPLDMFDIHVANPLEARYQLPDSTQRFIATAALADPRDPWAAATLTILIDGVETKSITLNQATPAQPINIPTQNARSLTLRLTPGPFGPIKNATTLHRPLLITNPDNQ